MKKRAFTLVELIVVITVFLILLSVSIPQMGSLLFSNQIEISGQELLHVLRKANSQASQQIYNNSWGIDLDTSTDTYTFFAGTSYSGRDTSRDIQYALSGSVSFETLSLNGGGDEIIFNQSTGETTQYGTIVIMNNEGETRTITINANGYVTSD